MILRIALLAAWLWSASAAAGGISASPLVIDKAITPDDNTVEFVLTNANNTEVHFTLSAAPAQHDALGVPVPGSPDYRFDLSRAIRFEQPTITIGPRRWRRVRARIEIPDGQRAGYAFIHARSAPQAIPGQSGVAGALAIAILVEASFPGEKQHQLEISELRVDRDGLRAAIRNRGDVHVKPAGEVRVETLDGAPVWSGQIQPANVFPELVRELRVKGPPLELSGGRYRARITISSPVSTTAEVLFGATDGRVRIQQAGPTPP